MVKNILLPIDKMDGDSLPVSTFIGSCRRPVRAGRFRLREARRRRDRPANGTPTSASSATAAHYVCPHATIRPFALTEEEAAAAPAAAKIRPVKAGKGKGEYQYTMAVSPLDCMGCGVCVGVCPTKAITMVAQESQLDQQAGLQLHGRQGRAEGRAVRT